MKIFLGLLVAALASTTASASETYWNTSDYLNRRTCPDTSCGIVGRLMHREKTEVFETRDGWARITEYYDASCRGGRSEWVDTGSAACTEQNGIRGGKFAEWVSLQYLSRTRPADPGAGASGIASLVSQSDDYRLYGPVFTKAAEQMIKEGRCTAADFKEMGGWMKSTNHGTAPIYFTYCGGMSTANRLYVDAKTGRVFK